MVNNCNVNIQVPAFSGKILVESSSLEDEAFIEELSEQTDKATNEIISIISELVKDVTVVNDTISNSTKSIDKQNEMEG